MRTFLTSPLLFVLTLALTATIAGTAVTAQESDPGEDSAPATSLFQPIAGNWSLLVNTGVAASPASLLAPLSGLASAAFTFDALADDFRSFRAGLPTLSDLAVVLEGEAFWVFVPPERLDGDLTFLEMPATVRGVSAELQPGFTLAGWTGSQGVPISQATAGMPVRRAYLWEAATQRFRIWDPGLPASLRDDFLLEYGAGLWVDLDAVEPVLWEQG